MFERIVNPYKCAFKKLLSGEKDSLHSPPISILQARHADLRMVTQIYFLSLVGIAVYSISYMVIWF